MPFFTSITRSGVRVWLEALARPGVVYIGGVPITLPAEAGDGIDLVAADVRGDVWAVCTGAVNDRGYLLKLSTGRVEALEAAGSTDPRVHGRYPSWVTEDGDVSWVQKDSPYVLQHLDGRKTDTRDTHNPHGPNESAVEDWGGVRVVNPFRSGSWECATWADDAPGAQTVLLRMNGGPVLSADTFRTQLPPHCAEHEDGSCTVPVQAPEGKDSPVFVRSEAFTRFEVPSVVYQPFPDNPHRCAIAIDGEPGGLLLGNADWPTLCRDGVLHDMRRPDLLARHIELARQAGSPILAYQDTSRPDLSGFVLELPNDVVSLPAFHGYPDRGESPEAHSARMTLLLGAMADMYPAFVVFAAGFLAPGQAGERTLHQVREGLRAIARAAARHPQLRMVVVFSFDRSSHLGPDGVSKLPAVAADVALWRASVVDEEGNVRNSDDYPTVAELRPTPQPEPVEPPRQPSGTPMPKPHLSVDTLQPDQVLGVDEMLWSLNRRFRLVNQSDGNLVLYEVVNGVDRAVWATGTDTLGLYWIMQSDGNLVAYNGRLPVSERVGLWASDTSVPWSVARLSDAGKLEIVSPAGEVLKSFPSADVPAQPEPPAPHGDPAPTPSQPEPSQPQNLQPVRHDVLRGQFVIRTRNPFAEWKNGDGSPQFPRAQPTKFFLAELDSLWRHDKAEAERILAEYKAAGFNHVVTGPVVERGYHGHYPDTDWTNDPDAFADFLEWLTREGMAFSLFLLPDITPWFHGTGHGWDMERCDRDFTPIYSHPRIQALTTRTVTAWEQWATMPAMAAAFDWQTRLFPNTERLWHNGPGHDSPCNGDEDSLDGWKNAAAHGITGYTFQTHPPQTSPAELDGREPIDMLIYDLKDMRRRLHGLPDSPWRNPPVLTPEGHLLTLEYMEGLAYGMYWTDDYDHLGPTWGAAAQSVPGVIHTLDGAP